MPARAGWCAVGGALGALALCATDLDARRKPKPAPCPGGRFVVQPERAPLITAAAGQPAADAIVLAQGSLVSIGSGCPEVGANVRRKRKRTRVTARWSRGACRDLRGRVRLRATLDRDCRTLRGTLRAKKYKRRFTATRGPDLADDALLAPVHEAERAVTAILGPAGGTVAATGSDGTRYELRVPPGVLGADMPITVTPVIALDGLPLDGGLVAAADLAPSGLAFAVPVTLTIRPTAPLAVSPIGFTWSGPQHRFAVAPWRMAPGRSAIQIDVAHFSGAGAAIPGPSQFYVAQGSGTVQATIAQNMHNYQVFKNCVAYCAGPQALANLLIALFYNDGVNERLEVAHEGLEELIAGDLAFTVWLSWVEMARDAGDLGQYANDPDLVQTIDEGSVLHRAALQNVFDQYTGPECSGEVLDWLDFIRIPHRIANMAASSFYTQPDVPPDEWCVNLRMVDVDFPATFGAQDAELPLAFRVIVDVTGGAPVVVPVDVMLDVEGASALGGTQKTTDPGGAVSWTLVPAAGAGLVRVRVTGTVPGVLDGDLGELVATNAMLDLEAPVASFVEYDEPPVSLCATAATADGQPLPGHAVTFGLAGLGTLLAPTTVTTAGDGTACVDYQPPTGPVPQSLATPVVTAEMPFADLVLEASAPFALRWAELALEVRTDGGSFVPATNTTVDTFASEVDVRATVTGAGATPADAGGPLALAGLTAATDAGVLTDGSTEAAELPLETAADGTAVFTWRDVGDPDEATITLRHPATGFGVGASVTLDRTPDPTISVSPEEVTLAPDDTQQFAATVTGVGSQEVEWSATGGTIDADGLYTAGDIEGTFTVTATSTADPSLGGDATVMIVEGGAGDPVIIPVLHSTDLEAAAGGFLYSNGSCIGCVTNRVPSEDLVSGITLETPPTAFAGPPGTSSGHAEAVFHDVSYDGAGSLVGLHVEVSSNGSGDSNPAASATGLGRAVFALVFDVTADVAYTISDSVTAAAPNFPNSSVGATARVLFGHSQPTELLYQRVDRTDGVVEPPIGTGTGTLTPGRYGLTLRASSTGGSENGGPEISAAATTDFTLTLTPVGP